MLIAGALLLLLGAVGAFYFWNNNEKHVRYYSLLIPLFLVLAHDCIAAANAGYTENNVLFRDRRKMIGGNVTGKRQIIVICVLAEDMVTWLLFWVKLEWVFLGFLKLNLYCLTALHCITAKHLVNSNVLI